METVSPALPDVMDAMDHLMFVLLVKVDSSCQEINVLPHALITNSEMETTDVNHAIQAARLAQLLTSVPHVPNQEVNQSTVSATHVFIHAQIVPPSNHVPLAYRASVS